MNASRVENFFKIVKRAGQTKAEADLRRVDSPKNEQTNLFFVFDMKSKKAKK